METLDLTFNRLTAQTDRDETGNKLLAETDGTGASTPSSALSPLNAAKQIVLGGVIGMTARGLLPAAESGGPQVLALALVADGLLTVKQEAPEHAQAIRAGTETVGAAAANIGAKILVNLAEFGVGLRVGVAGSRYLVPDGIPGVSKPVSTVMGGLSARFDQLSGFNGSASLEKAADFNRRLADADMELTMPDPEAIDRMSLMAASRGRGGVEIAEVSKALPYQWWNKPVAPPLTMPEQKQLFQELQTRGLSPSVEYVVPGPGSPFYSANPRLAEFDKAWYLKANWEKSNNALSDLAKQVRGDSKGGVGTRIFRNLSHAH